ncbi:hypothetical protein Tsubulata_019006 [Turnera subulata]|uniref:UspA domain-containing protein n=1 Tax=Turnera subulata TaxID=218843 RepID=A0A9Q0JR35_9ROSI|nr:hypothetical protein Tsubulata_019006 [Turnera subulata]
MPGPVSFLRQLSSGREAWRSRSSRRWDSDNKHCSSNTVEGGWNYNNNNYNYNPTSLKQMEEVEGLDNINMYGGGEGGGRVGHHVMRKRVMVVVDQTSHSKHAMMWALTHVAEEGDSLTLLHIIPPPPLPPTHNSAHSSHSYSTSLATTLGSLCKASRPEVEVEALVIQGPKLATVMSQVKKLEVSVLVLGHNKSSPLLSCLCGSRSSSEEFVEQCINNVGCWTIGVRKQSKGMSGYLITTRRQKDFWLLA